MSRTQQQFELTKPLATVDFPSSDRCQGLFLLKENAMKLFTVTLEVEVPDNCFSAEDTDHGKESKVESAVCTLIGGLSDWDIYHSDVVMHEMEE